MFDEALFKNLLNETSSLIKNLEESKDIEMEDRISCNVLALKVLANDIEDEDLKSSVLKKIESIYNTGIYMSDNINNEYQIKGDKETKIREKSKNDKEMANIEIRETDELRNRLETDLLNYSKLLNQKVKNFKTKIDEDTEVLQNTENVFSKNLFGVEDGVSRLRKQVMGGFSPLRMLFLSIFIFLLMYFFIRFF
ncbi:hypothetical protein CWI38_0935p0040 [Hamiltosporidium tvaerminnensis]|uniref:Uncharacterized protein n=2 Tax=Hamiltosporidium TaxID=1176354 RepID=A0A4Q9L080_9MICR|nr:hypothetical protein CWI39_1595p0010 [Hamiltosporidium magnivora]TBU12021.1 hypothetical protein CWI38_0935p0040 [Hamiltosporidium tvaerminnensis]